LACDAAGAKAAMARTRLHPSSERRPWDMVVQTLAFAGTCARADA
jgi:hypothetical protein